MERLKIEPWHHGFYSSASMKNGTLVQCGVQMLGPSKWSKRRCLLPLARHLQHAYRCKYGDLFVVLLSFKRIQMKCKTTKTNGHNSSNMKDDLFNYVHHNRGPLGLLNTWDFNGVINSNTFIFPPRVIKSWRLNSFFFSSYMLCNASERYHVCLSPSWLPLSVVVKAKLAEQTNSISLSGQVGSLPCSTNISQQVSAELYFSATPEGVSDGRVTQEVLLTGALRLFVANKRPPLTTPDNGCP